MSASSWIETGDEERSMNNLALTVAGRRAARLCRQSLLIAGLAAALAGCKTTAHDTTGGIPIDYRDRHPIAIKEGRKTLTLFVGPGRGGLSPAQRAEVLAFAQNWKRDASGGVTIDRPVGGPNQRAISDTLKETLSIVVQAGVPNSGIGVRPDDLGPSNDPKHFENRQYYNFGCASQRNLAAMVANPHDMVQPRAETPPWTAKRTFGTEKWRKGESPATIYADSNKGAISDLGK
jgi:pilus assembly protein CpaD